MKNNNLIQARENKNLTQEQLAVKLGKYGKQTISNWENGRSIPRIEDAFLVSEILEVDFQFLFGIKVQDSHTENREKVTS